MKTYKLEISYYDDIIKIGDKVEVDSEYIDVITILKVDFNNKIIWFSGVPSEDLF